MPAILPCDRRYWPHVPRRAADMVADMVADMAAPKLSERPAFRRVPTDELPIDPDDDRWESFLPDDDPYEPHPEPGDFWLDADEAAVAPPGR